MNQNPPTRTPSHHEEGFALIILIVAIFIILLFLGIAAPKVAHDLRREREIEATHRANEYVRAIQLYYRKFNSYPTTIDQLEKTNNIRFLRKQYDDPMTGKPDWRLILVGQNKTTVKGLFGQPLAGIPTTGIGGTSTPGSPATGAGGAAGTFGGTTTGGLGVGGNTSSGTSGSTTFGQTGATGSNSGSSFGSTTGSTTGTTGIGSQSATDFKGAAGPFMGIGHNYSGDSIITLNEQTDYSTWEFLYDPRIEQLKAKSSLFGGGAATSATSPALGSSFGNGTSPATPTTTSPTSTSPASGATTAPTQP
jgi:type II secretory pathway pseudopilin PulG